jgi:hypothetical protein
MHTKWLIGATLFLLFFVAVVSCISELRPWMAPEDFKIYILNGFITGSYEEVEPFIKSLSLDEPVFVITAADIETYDWGKQTITLTKGATQRMGSTWQIFEKAFVIMLGKDKLYGGVVAHIGSARRLDFPVIYAYNANNDQISLEIRPKHDFREYTRFDPKLKAIIEIDAVHTLFRRLGKIR